MAALGLPPAARRRLRAVAREPHERRGIVTAADRDARRATTHAFEDSLAIAGRTGTLRRRMRGTFAAGACHGKTGTLNRVSTLAGLCVTREGHTIVFAMMLNDVASGERPRAQDRDAARDRRYRG